MSLASEVCYQSYGKCLCKRDIGVLYFFLLLYLFAVKNKAVPEVKTANFLNIYAFKIFWKFIPVFRMLCHY